MKPYFYKGRIAPDLRTHILENGARFQHMMAISIEAFGGRLVRCHLEAESGDPAGFLEFPDDLSARAWSSYYGSQAGVLSSHIKRMLDEEDLQAMATQIAASREVAEAHRV